MKNEPKEIYLFCYDKEEKDPSCLPVDDDFESLDPEFINWSENEIEGCVQIRYINANHMLKSVVIIDHTELAKPKENSFNSIIIDGGRHKELMSIASKARVPVSVYVDKIIEDHLKSLR